MNPIPVTILGGSDQKPGTLPASGTGLHPLASYKGVAVRVAGRPLIEHLVQRVAAVPGFGPIHLAGPARVYAPLGLDATTIDTDGNVAANLEAAVEAHRASQGGMLAVLACDVLPSVRELTELRAQFEAARPCALWSPFVRVPEDPERLGAFSWKPAYRVRPGREADPVRILPGHLCIFDPEALRLPLLYRLMETAYRTRNRSVRHRRAALLRSSIGWLVAQDARLLLRLRRPDRTWTTLCSGLRLARKLRGGGAIELGELERLIGRMFLKREAPEGTGIRYPISDVLSLAEDIDTEEEALQLDALARDEASAP